MITIEKCSDIIKFFHLTGYWRFWSDINFVKFGRIFVLCPAVIISSVTTYMYVLLPIIQAHTVLGTTIHSDDWAAYVCLVYSTFDIHVHFVHFQVGVFPCATRGEGRLDMSKWDVSVELKVGCARICFLFLFIDRLLVRLRITQ